jgi:D-amino peptidase
MHCLTARVLAAFGALFATAAAAAPPGQPFKVYISADMEGVAGVVTASQLRPEGFEYERFRRFMTDETLAAVRAAKKAGATEIVVSDSHGNGENLLIEQFPRDVRIVRSWPRRGATLATLDGSFAAVVLIGYHASTSNTRGVRAHTYSSAYYTRVALNGTPVGEVEFSAAYAGEKGVPVVFVSGDDAMIAEVRGHLGDVEAVETKQALTFHSARTLTPQESVARIEAGVARALARRTEFKPFVLQQPIALDISYKNYTPAEAMSFLRIVERIDSHTIRFRGRDMEEVTDFLEFAGTYRQESTP